MQLQRIFKLAAIGAIAASFGIVSSSLLAQFDPQVRAQSTQEATQEAAPQTENEQRQPDAPFVPTPQAVVDEMLKMAKVQKGDMIYDLGSGDGRIPITAAKEYGARGVGIDIDPKLVQAATENAKQAGVSDLVEFRQQDLFKANFSDATVLTLYLFPEMNAKLRPQMLKQLKPGTRIVAHDFAIEGWKPDRIVEVKGPSRTHTLYYWVIPENAATLNQ
jgi:predicted O-methyltransferase YrrM